MGPSVLACACLFLCMYMDRTSQWWYKVTSMHLLILTNAILNLKLLMHVSYTLI